MAFNPALPSQLIVGTPDGVYFSRDGGATWEERELAGKQIFDLQVNKQVLDIATPEGIYQTTLDAAAESDNSGDSAGSGGCRIGQPGSQGFDPTLLALCLVAMLGLRRKG